MSPSTDKLKSDRGRLRDALKKLTDLGLAPFKGMAKKAKELREKVRERIRSLTAKIKAKKSGPTLMYDSIDVSRIPANAPAVAGYVNGWWPTYNEVVRRFPKAKKLSIAVNSGANADCLDIEPGNATASDAPAWVRRQHARGLKRPVLYANRSQMPIVLRIMRESGFPRSSYRVWTAHYGQGKHICTDSCYSIPLGTEADATQWVEDHARNLDINELKPSFFGGG